MKKTSMKMGVVALTVVAVTAIVSLSITARAPSLKVATTSSLYDTGLWEYLEPRFEERYGVKLDILCVSTGIALEYGKRGDVDVIVIHDKAREEQFIAEGYGVDRIPFAYNYFLIVGPPDDPAGIKGLGPKEAFKKLVEEGLGNPREIKFVSRGDESGTHAKEKAIWEAADFDYETIRKAGDWYAEGGRGMGPTLLMASEMNAYTLTDMGTFLAYKCKLDLVPLVGEGRILLNVYSVIAVNPEKHPHTRIEMANNLIDFLTSSETQKLIGAYGVGDYGMPLFMPCAGAEPEQ